MSLVDFALIVPILALPLALALLAVAPSWHRRMLDLLPLAPVPGLLAAFLAPEGTSLAAPHLLLGMQLEISGYGALFLGFASFLWIAAGFFARSYMRGSKRIGGFCAFWCLTLAGNLGVFIAGDAATFYLAFACVSLSAYPLIVHERTERAMRAGLVYIVLALIGETLLLLGMLLAVAGADSLLLADVRAALAGPDPDHVAIALLVAGFGIKAGLVPLHVWLPLAHPAAPTPASAVLSGAIVKAGIFGLIQFMPAGSDPGVWDGALMAAGLFTTWFGILMGLTQVNPKTILAYSTVSQMGLIITVLGAALQAGAGPAALAAATLYALHHGLAKGALFMGVGVMQRSGSHAARVVMAALVLLALSVAGLPLTGGTLAKLAIKGPLGGGAAELLVTMSAIGTGLVLLRFVFVVASIGERDRRVRPPVGLVLPFLSVGAAALVTPWFVFPDLAGQPLSYAFTPGNMFVTLWPVVAAAAIAILALWWRRLKLPAMPEGDLVVPVAFVLGGLARLWSALSSRLTPAWPAPRKPMLKLTGTILSAVEAKLSNWATAGTIMVALALALMAVNGFF